VTIARLFRRALGIFLRGFGTKLEFLHPDLSRLGIQEKLSLGACICVPAFRSDKIQLEHAEYFYLFMKTSSWAAPATSITAKATLG
jgi:hypothetical protein